MSALEAAHYGAHSVVPQARLLALFYSPGGALQKMVVGKSLLSQLTCPPSTLDLGKFSDRLRLFSRPQISIQARCVASFVHSVILYVISCFGITTRDLNYLRQSAVRMVLKRYWLEAEILPYVLRYLE